MKVAKVKLNRTEQVKYDAYVAAMRDYPPIRGPEEWVKLYREVQARRKLQNRVMDEFQSVQSRLKEETSTSPHV